MELPPYRLPTTRSITMHMWSKAVQYLRKISGIILAASIIIWALGYFPDGTKYEFRLQEEKTALAFEYELLAEQIAESDTTAHSLLDAEKEDNLQKLESNITLERQQNSYIGRIGRSIQPIMAPLGFDWKMTISILSGVAAKEIVVSTLGVLYQADEGVQAPGTSLVEKLQNQTYTYGPMKGEKVFTPLVALSFMLFILLYFPCIGVIAAISRESGHWKWGLFTVVYTTLIAWVVSLLVYQVGQLFF